MALDGVNDCQTQDSMEPNAHKTNCRDNENRTPMKAQEVIQSHVTLEHCWKSMFSIFFLRRHFCFLKYRQQLVHATARNVYLCCLYIGLCSTSIPGRRHFLSPWTLAAVSDGIPGPGLGTNTVSEDLSGGFGGRNFVLTCTKDNDDFRWSGWLFLIPDIVSKCPRTDFIGLQMTCITCFCAQPLQQDGNLKDL